MCNAHTTSLSMKRSTNMHQTRVVGGYADFGSRVQNVPYFVTEHRH
jgi:hypothetical protein